VNALTSRAPTFAIYIYIYIYIYMYVSSANYVQHIGTVSYPSLQSGSQEAHPLQNGSGLGTGAVQVGPTSSSTGVTCTLHNI
jgi:hypothetical protein